MKEYPNEILFKNSEDSIDVVSNDVNLNDFEKIELKRDILYFIYKDGQKEKTKINSELLKCIKENENKVIVFSVFNKDLTVEEWKNREKIVIRKIS